MAGLNFVADDLEPQQCAQCNVQNTQVLVCFEGVASPGSYVDYWRNFPRSAEEQEFDDSADYVGSIIRAVVPWLVIGTRLHLCQLPAVHAPAARSRADP